MGQRGQVDVPLGLASRAFDFEPRVAGVDGLVDRTAAGRRTTFSRRTAPWHQSTHPTPLSGGDRKALQKELGRARAMTSILAAQAAEARAKGEALIRQADKLLSESWNERMWSDGEPIDPSPTSSWRPVLCVQVLSSMC
jgi:hypothetical protein